MKGRFFSVGIFREYFRQLKIVGIIGTVLYGIAGVFIAIGINLEKTDAMKMADAVYGPHSEYVQTIGSSAVCAVQLLIPMAFVPLLMLVAFHFLTKRNSSDFYHALPIRREAMYISILAAVLAWTLVIAVLPLTVMWVLCLPLRAIEFPPVEALKAIFNTVVSSLFMIGVFALGINLSGTLFTNIVTSGIVLVLPRLILVMCWVISGALIRNSVMNFHIERLMVYGNPITKLFCIGLSYDFGAEPRTFFASGLLAGVLEGLAYVFAGGLFFRWRKSEAASLSSVNRGVQSIIRHVLALVMSTVASVFLVGYIWYGETNEWVVFMAVLFYVLAVVVYFLYELITTRKWRSAAGSAKQLPLFAGLTVAVFVLMSIVSNRENAYRIDAGNISSMKVLGVSRWWGDDIFLENGDFPVAIDSADIRKRIADAYNSEMDYRDYDSRVCDIIIAVKENGVTHRRYVYLTQKDFNAVLGELYRIMEVDVSERMPRLDPAAGSYRLNLRWNIEEPCSFTTGEIAQIYHTLREELLEAENPAALFFAPWKTRICTVEFGETNGAEILELPVSLSTPKTFALIQGMIEEASESERLEELFDEVLNGGVKDMEIFGRTILCADERSENIYYGLSGYGDAQDLERFRKVYDILGKYEPDGSPTGKNVVIETFGCYSERYYAAFGVYNISDEDMAALWQIVDSDRTE